MTPSAPSPPRPPTLPARPSPAPLEPRFAPEVSVKIVGLGGVGSIVADYATLWLAAQASARPDVGFRCVLIDGDAFEPANTRMFFARCGPKAEVKRDDLVDRLGERADRLVITAVPEYLAPGNLDRLLREGDHVLLCVDNHASRKLVSDHFAGSIRDGVLVSAGNDGVGAEASSGRVRRGTFGNCQAYVRRGGRDETPPLTRFHPEIASPQDAAPHERSCTEMLAGVPQLLFANYWAAGAILSTWFLSLCGEGALPYFEVAFDVAEGKMLPYEIDPSAR